MPRDEESLEHNVDAEALADKAPWDDIQTDPTLPTVAYLFEVQDLTFDFMGDQRQLVVVMELEILQPAEYSGRVHYERLWIGTDRDPQAQKAQTWDSASGSGALNLNVLRVKTGSRTWRDLKGKRFVAQAYTREGNDGRRYTNLTAYAAEGELNPGTPTPERKFTRKRGPRGGGLASDITPDASIAVMCDACGKQFPQGDIATHMAMCSGSVSF